MTNELGIEITRRKQRPEIYAGYITTVINLYNHTLAKSIDINHHIIFYRESNQRCGTFMEVRNKLTIENKPSPSIRPDATTIIGVSLFLL